jgi:NAD(P)-dependent dehydrogenase (short-subunit alcohol dehydrogenase family)
MELFDLSGKVAIVTGGNQGIGYGIARGLAGAGATVVIANRRADAGQAAAEFLKKDGFNAVAVPTDVTSPASIEALVSKVAADFGGIDVMVNNAGIVIRKPAEQMTAEEWDRIMDTNLKGMFFCCQEAARKMIPRQQGKIINVSSEIAEQVQPLRSVYAISKAGISHMTRALALEWSRHHINVNAIAPGVTVTPINENYFKEHPEQMEKYVGNTPLGRVARPDDYAGAAVFLASEASSFVTGHILVVDGGMVIC